MCCSRLHVSLVDTTHGAVLLNSDWVMVGAFKGKIFGSQHIIYVRLFPMARAAPEMCLLFNAEKHRKKRVLVDAFVPGRQRGSCRQYSLPRRTCGLDVVPAQQPANAPRRACE